MLDTQPSNEIKLHEPRYPRRGWIGVDLDGTLAKYDPTRSSSVIGPPVPLMIKRVLLWIKTGRTVKIFTARASDARQKKIIHEWCLRHGLPELEITDRKDHRMLAMWDDRAVGVVLNTGVPVLPARLTLQQRLRLILARFIGGSILMKIFDVQLHQQIDAGRIDRRSLFEPQSRNEMADGEKLAACGVRKLPLTLSAHSPQCECATRSDIIS